MKLGQYSINNLKVAEVLSDGLVISSAQDGLDLLGDVYYQGYDAVIVHEENITPRFFDLKTGIAGEILQKFSNYRMRMAVTGDFSKYASQSLRDFIFESNKGRHICFVQSVPEALQALSR